MLRLLDISLAVPSRKPQVWRVPGPFSNTFELGSNRVIPSILMSNSLQISIVPPPGEMLELWAVSRAPLWVGALAVETPGLDGRRQAQCGMCAEAEGT